MATKADGKVFFYSIIYLQVLVFGLRAANSIMSDSEDEYEYDSYDEDDAEMGGGCGSGVIADLRVGVAQGSPEGLQI